MDDLGKFHLNVTHGFGVSKEGRNLAVMMSETSILYSLGRKIVIHDIEHNKQKAIDIGSKVKAITGLQVGPKKRYLAICECTATSYFCRSRKFHATLVVTVVTNLQ